MNGRVLLGTGRRAEQSMRGIMLNVHGLQVQVS